MKHRCGRLTVWDRSDLCGTVDGKQGVTVFSRDTVIVKEPLRGISRSVSPAADKARPQLQLYFLVSLAQRSQLAGEPPERSTFGCARWQKQLVILLWLLWPPTQMLPHPLAPFILLFFYLCFFPSTECVSVGTSGNKCVLIVYDLYFLQQRFPKMTGAESSMLRHENKKKGQSSIPM